MERRNNPTNINYMPIANNNLSYDVNAMKGLQIKQFFQNGGLENTLILNISTAGFKNIKLSFAALDELAGVTGISIDYAINSGTPIWITTGLTNASLQLLSTYQLFQTDFTSITSINDNANFKVRLRFTGPNMTLDAGNRVTFNNIAVEGVELPLLVVENENSKFKIYPNPFSEIIKITGMGNFANYSIFTIDGKLIHHNKLQNSEINFGELSKGIYLLQLTSDGVNETHKIIKQ
jgi:hypothetical protein